ncbi:MAG: hypothetical protein HDR43_00720 [Mycoplasma sp.]|nr:hypothetical protein [Mycoplasma sp.]
MPKFKKILFCTPLLITPALLSISCNNANSWQLPKTKNIAQSKENGQNDIEQIINKPEEVFLTDIKKYADDDSILFYNVGLTAVAHRYIPLAHLMNVLQLNPNKQIYLFVNTLNSFIPKISEQFKTKHPNFKIIEYQASSNISSGDFEYNYGSVTAYKDTIKNENLDTSKIVLTTDDYFFLTRLQSYINGKTNQDGFIEDYLMFFNLREVNMISDGTASIKFFDNLMFDYMNQNQDWFELTNGKYNNAINFVKYFSELNEEQKVNFIKNEMNNYNLNITKILYSLLIASKNEESISKGKFNFYVPALEMIIDANNTSSLSLSHNDYYNYFFNPYNSQNMNFIKLTSQLNNEMNKEFLLSIGLTEIQINDINNYENEFNNFHNVIYTGSMFSNSPTALEEQAKALISIYQENYENRNKIKIWFKAHPREDENYQILLKDKITSLGYPEISNAIYFLNKSIPMEVFIGKDFMKNDQTNNREVKFYISFSTIGLYLYTNKQQDSLSRTLISESDKKFINTNFGSFDQSILYPESKTILIDDFANLYNFKTSINTNMNYIIFNENNDAIIEWRTFSDYASWPFFSILNYKIIIKYGEIEYEFIQNEAIPSYNSGIALYEKNKINDMISTMTFKNYNLNEYINDTYANSIMNYNLNLAKENRKYSIANVQIQYLNKKGKWEIFSNTSDFVILKDF